MAFRRQQAKSSKTISRSTVHVLLDKASKRLTLWDSKSAKELLRAIITSGDDLSTLYTLTEAERSLKSALALVNDPVEILKFLEFLGKDELNRGSAKRCVEMCYMAAFTTPGLLGLLADALKKDRICSDRDYEVLTWFLVAAVRIDPSARLKSNVLTMVEKLLSRESEAGDVISALLYSNFRENHKNVVFDPRSVQSLDHLQAMTPNHDNDFPLDFRKVQILPTVEELNSSAPTSLSFQNIEESTPVGVATSYMLDRQFRLLREDMIAPMREEMKNELEMPPGKQRRVFNAPEIVELELEPRACLLVRVEMPTALKNRLHGKKTKEVCAFFEETGRRVLGKDSMVVFLGKAQDSNSTVKAVGLVVRRDVSEFAVTSGYLTVGVVFSDDMLSSMLSLLPFQFHVDRGNDTNKRKPFKRGSRFASCMFQATSSYFSYEPVLRTLQNMGSIPFADEIVMGSKPLECKGGKVKSISSSVVKKLSSDLSQLRAVESAVRQRMTLVQGPPGTGISRFIASR
jgi:hypothetical protein